MTFRSEEMDRILDYAIAREIEASQFYTDLAALMGSETMKEVFRDFAREELGHKAKLEDVKRGEYALDTSGMEVKGMGLAENLVESEPTPEMTYAEALILAMKKEKAAYRLYMDLADSVGTGELAEMFRALAAEEAKHKLRFELEYDEVVLKEA
ncbi:MAG: ferritin family protein [Sedimentisphaerales bacterium]|nr:ferritin family protein [Sedimentisphaerales bacterium]